VKGRLDVCCSDSEAVINPLQNVDKLLFIYVLLTCRSLDERAPLWSKAANICRGMSTGMGPISSDIHSLSSRLHSYTCTGTNPPRTPVPRCSR
jgi:hypothetical protein